MKIPILILFGVLIVGGSRLTGHPNVLLIIVDDLRPSLGCYGDTLALTPNIDALAHEGTIFTRAYAQQALCGPSRTSFLTSRRPGTTRLYDVHSYWRKHAGNFTTLPQYFKEFGYHTMSVGKIFHPGIVSNHSDDQPYSWSETPFHPPTQAHKQDPVCLGLDGKLHTNIYCPVQVEEQPGGSLPDIQTTQFAVNWLEERADSHKLHNDTPSDPFFLAVGYHKPHIPLKFPAQFLDLYPISSIPLAPNPHLPAGLPPVAWNPWNDLRWRADIAALNVSFPYGPMPDYYARYIRQGYYAATTYTDSLIGDLMNAINSHFPDTLIAFIGDHGWSLGEHQEWSKFSNFEVATRVPFIVNHWKHHKTSPFKGYTSLYQRRNGENNPPMSKGDKRDGSEKWSRNHVKYGHLKRNYVKKYEDLKIKPVYKYEKRKSEKRKSNRVDFIEDMKKLYELEDLNRKLGYSEDLKSKNTKISKDVTKNSVYNYEELTKHNKHNIKTSMNLLRDFETSRLKFKSRKLISHDGLVELVDLFPTLVDLAGLPALDTCPQDSRLIEICTEGMSLSPLLQLIWNNSLPDAFKTASNTASSFPISGDNFLPLRSTVNKNKVDDNQSAIKIDKRYTGNSISNVFKTNTVSSFFSSIINGNKINGNTLVNAITDTTSVYQNKNSGMEEEESHSVIKSTQIDSKYLSGIGVKRAAFSQYPRPGPEPSIHPDSDQAPTRDSTIMGYSMRTLRYRYTIWVGFNGTTLTTNWSDVVAQELYDHRFDPQEDHNVVSHPEYTSTLVELHSELLKGWLGAVSVL